MRIVIKNEHGHFEMGGGGHPNARIIDIKGVGLPEKEIEPLVFSGQAGQITKSVRDLPRTITLSFDFFGNRNDIEKLYRILYYEVEIFITSGDRKRKIKGRCRNPGEVQKIIFHKWYSVALQFVCDCPYFEDFYNTRTFVNQRTNLFPNVYENGTWYIQLPAVATQRTTKAKISNQGQTEIYPVIFISCIALSDELPEETGINIFNETTGAFIFLQYDPLDGEEITVDLPHRKITGSISGNITNFISDDTVLSNFKLIPGENIINAVNLNTKKDISIVAEHNNNYVMAVI